jgi:hypothetical protein
MEMSSTDRALTTKSLCQWTAATTLFAVGSLAFLSANTIDKLSQQGDVSLDLEAFRKLGSISVALDRTEEQRLLVEEDRLIEKASFAQAEALPKPALKFSKSVGVSKKTRKSPRILAKNRAPAARVTDSGMTAAERIEIAALEKAPDPAYESAALASVYRRVRFQFVAAAESARTREAMLAQVEGYDADRREYGETSVQIAQEFEAHEFDEMPTYDGSDFVLPADRRSDTMIADTAPAPDLTVRDEIESTASATANPEIFSVDPLPPSQGKVNAIVLDHEKSDENAAITPVISTPGLDEVPSALVVSQIDHPVNTQKQTPEMSTGPPKLSESETSTPPASLATSPAQSTPSFDSVSPETSSKVPSAPVTAEDLPPLTTQDAAEYAADLQSIYPNTGSDDGLDSSDYSEDAEYSARPKTKTKSSLSNASNSEHGTTTTTNSITTSASQTIAAAPKNYGNGVSKDSGGITIDWNKAPPSSIHISRPDQKSNALTLADRGPKKDVEQSLGKFSFSAPAMTVPSKVAFETPVAEVDRSKCDTEKMGVEAFNPSAEKETLTVCRRPLSLEGSLGQDNHRWWEAYESENTHWPTLAFQRVKDPLQEKDRIPMLSTASIRILSTISRVNVHEGTGVVFGEIPRGLDIRLVGRSDAPIYLDSGMKVREVTADPSAKRHFIFLNVAPGQPLLTVTQSEKALSGSIPLVVKAGMATHIRVPEPTEKDATFTIYDASAKSARIAGITGEIIGQAGRMGISDKKGSLKVSKVVTFGAYPLYLDLARSEKSYKNRYRISPSEMNRPLVFIDEKRANAWISQLAGGVSPYSGMIVGMVPSSALSTKKAAGDSAKANQLRIGTFEKKSSLVPERYLIDRGDHLISQSNVQEGLARFVAVQIPEGVAIPSVIDAQGEFLWSEIVYAQPGVINIVGP